MDAQWWGFRFVVLICNCLLTFGSYYSFDMPSVLENDLKDLLHINSTEYGLFYSLYGWTNCVMSLCAGWIVDRYGTRRSAFLFLSLVVVGQVVFALGATMTSLDDKAQFYIMLAGRFIFGTGGGSITIVQNCISAHWFKGKELALAFGVTLTMSRLGSILNFFTTRTLCNHTSLTFTLWFAAGACCIGVVAALLFSCLDRMAARQLGQDQGASGKVVRLSDVRTFDARYWLLTSTICFFYVCVFPFIATAPDMFRERQHYSKNSPTPSYLASTLYFVSIVLSIPMGRIVDSFGRQSVWAISGAFVTVPVFLVFALTDVYPLWPMLALGVAYSVMASSLWPSIALVVELSTVGTAMGVATSVQMLGVGITTIAAGTIQDSHYSWDGSNLFFAGMGGLALTSAVLLWVVDKARGGKLSAAKLAEPKQEPAEQAWLLEDS